MPEAYIPLPGFSLFRFLSCSFPFLNINYPLSCSAVLLRLERLLFEAMFISDLSLKCKNLSYSADYYRRRRRQLEKGIIQNRHAVSTKNNIDQIKGQ